MAKILWFRSNGKRITGLVSAVGILTLLYLWQLCHETSIEDIMEELVTEKDRSVRVTSPHGYLEKQGRQRVQSRPWRVLCWITTYPGNFEEQLIFLMMMIALQSKLD